MVGEAINRSVDASGYRLTAVDEIRARPSYANLDDISNGAGQAERQDQSERTNMPVPPTSYGGKIDEGQQHNWRTKTDADQHPIRYSFMDGECMLYRGVIQVELPLEPLYAIQEEECSSQTDGQSPISSVREKQLPPSRLFPDNVINGL